VNKRKVLVAGLFHETHTFLDGRTRLADFEIRQGSDLLSAIGDASPLAGVLEVGKEEQWSLIPALDMRAMPGAVVEDRVVEAFWQGVRLAVELSNGLDGIFLILHGAMVSESLDDVEGELLFRIRRLPGCSNVPLCGVLDLHANVTEKMVAHVDAIVAYRENPHTDAKEAAMDAARLLTRLMNTRERTMTVWEHPPILWPPTGTATADEPMRSLQNLAREMESSSPEILAINVFAGFAFADVPDAGVSFTATTTGSPATARNHLSQLAELATKNRERGNVTDAPLAEVLQNVMKHNKGPIVIAEPSDNVGAGAPGSGVSLLRGFLEHSMDNSAVIIDDPDAVATVATRGRGELGKLTFGGKGSSTYAKPITLDVKLLSTSDGRFDLEDRQSHLASMFGAHIDMGHCAVIGHKGVRVLLTSRKTPPFDLGQLRSQGIEPSNLFAVGAKAAVAHRSAYDRIAVASYSADTAGPCSSNLRSFPYKKLRRPIYPLDSWTR
jgi:microcystin degradation protein MlrC